MQPSRPQEAPGYCLLRGAGPHSWRREFLRPAGLFTSRGTSCRFTWEGDTTREVVGDPFRVLDTTLKGYPHLVAAGYWSYELGRVLERLPSRAARDLDLPDCYIGLYDRWQVPPAPLPRPILRPAPKALATAEEGERYRQGVRRIQNYIAAGDCYQVNLSHRFRLPHPGSPWDLYQRLESVSPAPYSAYLNCGDHHVLSASPELFLSVAEGRAVTRPIKGTRPRAADALADLRAGQELLQSAKDRAELVMIVDLERNDLGRVCRYGSVRVPELYRLESYPQVHHLVATVTGELRSEVSPLECLRACFPGGSITGAPKIRAMEIIEELEPVRRGVYTGAIGWVDGQGRGEWNIAIRTLVLKDGVAHFHAGAGIVADSDPDAEWRETLAKASGLWIALSGEADTTF